MYYIVTGDECRSTSLTKTHLKMSAFVNVIIIW